MGRSVTTVAVTTGIVTAGVVGQLVAMLSVIRNVVVGPVLIDSPDVCVNERGAVPVDAGTVPPGTELGRMAIENFGNGCGRISPLKANFPRLGFCAETDPDVTTPNLSVM